MIVYILQHPVSKEILGVFDTYPPLAGIVTECSIQRVKHLTNNSLELKLHEEH